MGDVREIVLCTLVGIALGACILVVAEQLGARCWMIEEITGEQCSVNGNALPQPQVDR